MIYHDVLELFLASRMSSGARRIAKRLSQMYGRPINRKRIARIMRENGLVPKGKKKYVVTTVNVNIQMHIFYQIIMLTFYDDVVASSAAA